MLKTLKVTKLWPIKFKKKKHPPKILLDKKLMYISKYISGGELFSKI